MKMATLTDIQKEILVTLHARYYGNKDIQEIMEKDYNVKLSYSQVRYYNPEDLYNKGQLHDKWLGVFSRERKQTKEAIESIPLSSKVYRLQRLQHQIDYMDEHTDEELGIEPATRIAIMTTLIEKAEKMMGEYFSQIPKGGGAGIKKLKQSSIIQEFDQPVIQNVTQLRDT